MTGDRAAVVGSPVDRVRLEALRYAVNDEAVTYVAIMRTFTGGLAGLLSDRSAAEVAAALVAQGLELDIETVDDRLRYLVERGNLALSPRETEARSIRDYLATRARYQLTQRGELVHRQVEELLGSTEAAREVSSEMLGAILDGVRVLAGYDEALLSVTPPDRLAREATTVVAQFERLVESTRAFYLPGGGADPLPRWAACSSTCGASPGRGRPSRAATATCCASPAGSTRWRKRCRSGRRRSAPSQGHDLSGRRSGARGDVLPADGPAHRRQRRGARGQAAVAVRRPGAGRGLDRGVSRGSARGGAKGVGRVDAPARRTRAGAVGRPAAHGGRGDGRAGRGARRRAARPVLRLRHGPRRGRRGGVGRDPGRWRRPGGGGRARRNAPSATVEQRDVRRLALPDAAVGAVVSNLPFGQQFAVEGAMSAWLAAALTELARVIRPGGRLVLLAPFVPRSAVPAALRVRSKDSLRLLGTPTALWVLDRAGAAPAIRPA